MTSVVLDNWTAERAIIASNEITCKMWGPRKYV